MRHRVLTLVSLLSLLICVLSTAIWIRSYWQSDRLTWEWSGGDLVVGSSVDRVEFWLLFLNRPTTQHLIFDYYHANSREEAENWANQRNGSSLLNHFGFYFDHHVAGVVTARWAFTLPWWSVTGVFALLPMIWLRHWRRRGLQRNVCAKCGYSLTGNTSGTCPECGTAVTQASTPAQIKP